MAQRADTTKNPVKRDGVSQKQRRLDILDPGKVKVDERSTQDFLLFAREFASQLHYYDKNNKINGSWVEFWGYHPSVVISAVEKYNPLLDKENFNDIYEATPCVIEGVEAMFGIIRKIAWQINDWTKLLSSNVSKNEKFGLYVKKLIAANLEMALPQLLAYEKGAAEWTGDSLEEVEKRYFDEENDKGFLPVWNLGDPAAVSPNTALFNPIRLFDEDEIPEELPEESPLSARLNAAYEGLLDQFTSFYNILFQIIKGAPEFFTASLNRKDHEPHLALFITFLKLYQLLRDDLNRISQRHLDFYYKDVLQLKTKGGVADKVHLFFELAKQVEEHQLKKDIRFKAGKDAEGKNLFYTLNKDTVLNRAQIADLKSLYFFDDDDGSSVHIAAVANSADGLGAEFPKTEEKPSWPTLGNESLPEAELGFAIASRELLLVEGTRKVELIISLDKNLPYTPEEFRKILDVSLSGEKEWIKVELEGEADPSSSANLFDSLNPAVQGVTVIQSNRFPNQLVINFTLSPEDPAIVGLDSKVLKTEYGTDLPVLRVLFKQFSKEENPPVRDVYKNLRQAKITGLKLTVDVQGVNTLIGFNRQGGVDLSKPLMPFGPTPAIGSELYIGSTEAFQKSLDELTLHFAWENVPKDFQKHYAGYYKDMPSNDDYTYNLDIVKKQGASDAILGLSLFKAEEVNHNVVVTSSAEESEAAADYGVLQTSLKYADPTVLRNILRPQDLANYGGNTDYGLLRMTLQKNFWHKAYPKVLTRQMLAAAKLPDTVIGAHYDLGDGITHVGDAGDTAAPGEVIIPNEAHTPVLQSVSLNYKSTVDLHQSGDAVKSENLLLLHLHPFENTYQHFETNKGTFAVAEDTNKPTLLPQFYDEGTLYIGLTDLEPLQSLTLLFQVAENTADAEIEPAEPVWFYLRDNTWSLMDKAEIPSDTTKGLITSGIVTFGMPDDINKDNTILPADYHWLKVVAPENAKAVSDTINLHTQAAGITFQDNDNADAHLEKPLPAKAIGKLEVGQSAVKKIHQEYESFGGRPKEDSLAFYTRISERLRHKGRAITLFDYERLVLEAFPDIFKVKCINHTNEDHRLRPGHVLLSVIPDFTKLKVVDRKKPKVTLSKLREINEYLTERNTAFIHIKSDARPKETLHIRNPIYESIQVDFTVQFKPDVTAKDYFLKQLQEAIVQYLSPWAYEDAADINFGGRVYKSSILDFVEDQEYVDWVADFKMKHVYAGGQDDDVAFAEAKTPTSILVPEDAEKMGISIVGVNGVTVACSEKQVDKDTLGYISFDGDYLIGDPNS